MRDPYTVLGVSKTATLGDIKKAFRKLAKQHHPDQNKDPKAATRFAEINTAYEIVGDEKRRAQYDRGEIDAEGKPRFQQPDFGGFDFSGARGGDGAGFHHFEFGAGSRGGGGFEDILSEMFGGRRSSAREQTRTTRASGNDIHVGVEAPFVTWALGGKTRIEMPDGRSLDVQIPAGIAPGKVIRLRGQGEPGPGGGKPGDALITVNVAPHPQFTAEGRNVRVEVPVTLYDAGLGGKVRVPTLEGSVDLTLPPGTNGQRIFRLKGKGIRAKDGAGDLLVSTRITLPKTLGDDLVAVLERMREKPYDPVR